MSIHLSFRGTVPIFGSKSPAVLALYLNSVPLLSALFCIIVPVECDIYSAYFRPNSQGFSLLDQESLEFVPRFAFESLGGGKLPPVPPPPPWMKPCMQSFLLIAGHP